MTSTVEMAFGELRASISLFPGHYSAVCWEKFPVLLGQGISCQELKLAGKFALSNLKNWHEFGKFPVNFPDSVVEVEAEIDVARANSRREGRDAGATSKASLSHGA